MRPSWKCLLVGVAVAVALSCRGPSGGRLLVAISRLRGGVWLGWRLGVRLWLVLLLLLAMLHHDRLLWLIRL